MLWASWIMILVSEWWRIAFFFYSFFSVFWIFRAMGFFEFSVRCVFIYLLLFSKSRDLYCMFDKMVQKPQSLSFVFHHAIVTNDRDIGFFEVLLTSPRSSRGFDIVSFICSRSDWSSSCPEDTRRYARRGICDLFAPEYHKINWSCYCTSMQTPHNQKNAMQEKGEIGNRG